MEADPRSVTLSVNTNVPQDTSMQRRVARTPTSASALEAARLRASRQPQTGSSVPVFGGGAAAEDSKGHGHSHKLGMIHGVFMPTCENMWGVIIFLRFYVIVGYAGLGLSILIVTLSFSVALLTALALSAIATCGTSHNISGVYPMLARALGKEIATATGLIYFLGIVCLAVLECLGACEELFALDDTLHLTSFRFSDYPVQIWGSIFMLSLVTFVAGGTKMIAHLGVVFFIFVILTLLSMYISLIGAPNLHSGDAPDHPTYDNSSSGSGSGSGGHGYIWPDGLSGQNFRNNFGPDFTETYSFATCLALFFPCFTGILSGANRASTLADPSTAIPNGTLGAIIFSYFMYTSLMVLFAGVGSRAFLQADHGQVNTLFWPSVAAAQIGIILSSLGQALQCLVVAPRLLASISASGTLHYLKPFAVLTAGEPKRALLVSYVFGGLLVLLGDLNLVAPLLSMCFLICYACMNLNCFFLDFLKDPHWRPKWKYFHWSVGLTGFVLCVAVQFMIDYIYAIVAWALVVFLLFIILRTNLSVDWGSALHGLRFHVAIRSLLSIDMNAHLNQNWKPQLLLLYTLREVERHEIVTERQQSTPEPISPKLTVSAGALPDKDKDDARAAQMRQLSEQVRQAEGPEAAEDSAIAADALGHTHEHMFAVAHQLRHGTGLIIAAAIMQLREDEATHDLAPVLATEEEERVMAALMKDVGVEGFPMAVLARDTAEGKAYAIQCAGLGTLTPNTVLMGWPWWWKTNEQKFVPEFLSTIHQATLRQKAMLVCHNIKDFPTNQEPQGGYIDVWWIKHDGGLLLLISHLLQKHRVWKKCGLRLHLITETGSDPEHLKVRVHRLLTRINISASVEEVIQIDTASLLPYIQSSLQRERNEAAAEEKLREHASTEEQARWDSVPQAKGHTAEQILLEHSEHNRQRKMKVDNPLDYASDDGDGSAHDGSMHGGARTADGHHGRNRRRYSIEGARSALGAAGPSRRRSDTADFDSSRSEVDSHLQYRTPTAAASASHHAIATVSSASAAEHDKAPPAHVQSPPPSPPDAALDIAPETALRREARAWLEEFEWQQMVAPSPTKQHAAHSAQHGGSRRRAAPSAAIHPAAEPPTAPPSPPEDATPPPSPPEDAPSATEDKPKEPTSPKSSGSESPLQQSTPPQRKSILTRAFTTGLSTSRNSLSSIQLPPPAVDVEGAGVAGGNGSPTSGTERNSKRRFSTKKELATPDAHQRSPGLPPTDAAVDTAALQRFIEKHGLAPDLASELTGIFEDSVKKAKMQTGPPAVTYRWDQIHEIIVDNSAGTSLVIINLPDPPDLGGRDARGDYREPASRAKQLDYMNYMEGVAENLPRVMYVHGSGQEIINFDHME